ncbi:MAG: DUF559 domain-containing protein [Hamadaea sp.]|nr:DUF559 domain-containing protein [Hamadaea sp.]
MTPGIRTATGWWNAPPSHQVSFLADVDAELLSIALDPLPASAPAVVQFRPRPHAGVTDQVAALLDALDRAARALYPRWLPGAERFDGATVLGAAAVRALAQRTAARSRDFGPFLVDLAERSLRDAPPSAAQPSGVRATGLARVIAAAYERPATAVLVVVPDGLTAEDELGLCAAAEWLAGRGFTAWLAGTPLQHTDRVQAVRIRLPERVQRLAGSAADLADPADLPTPPLVSYPPVDGAPRADSAAETALERALAQHPWARGRVWNKCFEIGPLSEVYRLDLSWADERLVVEVDGPDHRQRLKWARDRHRDNALQAEGHKVLRFPNEDVLADVQLVVQKIQHVLILRRAGARIPEMRHHAD